MLFKIDVLKNHEFHQKTSVLDFNKVAGHQTCSFIK